jgi:hypothetical protein
MAMTVMVIGATAVISMQKASVQGNLDARKTDVAAAVGRTWVERLKRDAMQWTCPSTACTTPNLGNALLLNGHVDHKWFLPVDYAGKTSTETMSPGFDILGRDLPLALLQPDVSKGGTGWPGATFCVNVRLTWLMPPVQATDPGLIRADVRVLWPRGIFGGAPASGFCDTNTAGLDDPETAVSLTQRPFFHALYMTTDLMENPAQ